jgi:hypothetical protein
METYLVWGAFLVGFFLVGGSLAYYVYRNPIKLIGLGTALAKAAWPYLRAFVLKRMSPEEEAKWRREQLTGVKPPPEGTGVTTGKTIEQPAKTEKTGRDR